MIGISNPCVFAWNKRVGGPRSRVSASRANQTKFKRVYGGETEGKRRNGQKEERACSVSIPVLGRNKCSVARVTPSSSEGVRGGGGRSMTTRGC